VEEVELKKKSVKSAKSVKRDPKELFQDKVFLVSVIVLLAITICAIFAPYVSHYDPNKMFIQERLTPPIFLKGGTVKFILGTDGLGRDVLTRILYGLRNSLLIAFLSVAVIFGIGIFVGLLSGIYGKKVDSIIMTVADIQLSVPLLVVAIILLALVRPSVPMIILVLSIAGWPAYARGIRASVLSEKSKDYILAARIMGASPWRILRKYFLYSVFLSTVGFIVLEFGLMIIWEALLSFLGIGIQPPDVSLGTIMGDGLNYLVSAWWITTLPGIFIMIIVLCLSFMSRKVIRFLSPKAG